MDNEQKSKRVSESVLIALLSVCLRLFYFGKSCVLFIMDNIVESMIIAAIVLVLGAISYNGYTELQSPQTLLMKSEWKCTATKDTTYMQPMMIGKTTTMVPVTDTICVEYARR